MITRIDVIRCDNLRTITAGNRTGQIERCAATWTAPRGIKIALRAATHRGWIEVHTPDGHKRHLCPACAVLTDHGRHATLATAGTR